MIDYTTVRTYDAPLDIKELQESNSELANKNKNLKRAIIIISGVLILISGFYLYNKLKRNYKLSEKKKY